MTEIYIIPINREMEIRTPPLKFSISNYNIATPVFLGKMKYVLEIFDPIDLIHRMLCTVILEIKKNDDTYRYVLIPSCLVEKNKDMFELQAVSLNMFRGNPLIGNTLAFEFFSEIKIDIDELISKNKIFKLLGGGTND